MKPVILEELAAVRTSGSGLKSCRELCRDLKVLSKRTIPTRVFELQSLFEACRLAPTTPPNHHSRDSGSGNIVIGVFTPDTVSFQNRKLQIEPVRWRGTLAGCSVMAHQHLDGTLSLSYGPHCPGRYDATGVPLSGKTSPALGRGRGTAPFRCNPIPQPAPLKR